MKTIFLAAAAVLSLAAGSVHAATATENSHTASAPSITAATNAETYRPVIIAPVPNPWDGTESWKQWNQDHPLQGGDG